MDWKTAMTGFSTYLRLEKGLAEHSIDAYLRDVHKLKQFIATESDNTRIDHVAKTHIDHFLAALYDLGFKSEYTKPHSFRAKSFF